MISWLNVIAVLLYCAAIGSCLRAAASAGRSGLPKRHRSTFLGTAALFAFFALSRLLSGEDALREWLRAQLREQGAYADRGDIQAVLVVVLALIAIGAAAFLVKRLWSSRSRPLSFLRQATMLAGLSFAALYGLRIISLHSVDAVLYAGPLRPNWIGDIGLTLAITAMALIYSRLAAKRA